MFIFTIETTFSNILKNNYLKLFFVFLNRFNILLLKKLKKLFWYISKKKKKTIIITISNTTLINSLVVKQDSASPKRST